MRIDPDVDGADGLDEEFPLGDGVADVSGWTGCPHCGEEIELAVDPGGGAHQEYVEDCPVCCAPMRLVVQWDGDGVARIDALPEDV